MSENSADRLVRSPDINRGQPADPNRRTTIKKAVGAILGVLGAAKLGSMAVQSKTGQDILKAAPWQEPPKRPSDFKMQQEINQGLNDVQSSGVGPEFRQLSNPQNPKK